MKFSVNTKELADALQNLLRAVSTKTSIPALEGILIKTDVGSIKLYAYDLEISMQTKILANIQENGSIILFHNGVVNTPAALDKILEILTKEGYSFVTVSDLIYKDNYFLDSAGTQHLKNE